MEENNRLAQLDQAAARRIQKYIEAESKLLKQEIEDKVTRPTDLLAFHAAKAEDKRRKKRRARVSELSAVVFVEFVWHERAFVLPFGIWHLDIFLFLNPNPHSVC